MKIVLPKDASLVEKNPKAYWLNDEAIDGYAMLINHQVNYIDMSTQIFVIPLSLQASILGPNTAKAKETTKKFLRNN
jgi:hypothetical protein